MKAPFFRATTPDGRWTVSVEQEDGRWFFASVALDGSNVTDSLTTDDPEKLIRWTKRQMEQAMRRTT